MSAAPSCHRRRASIYLGVLGVTMLVSLAGVAGLLAGRAQYLASRMDQDALQADLMAQSAVDLVLYSLDASSTWRGDHNSNEWSGWLTAGSLSYCYKLVDELDGDLADDASEPVRLYVSARCGEAVRLWSVQLVCWEPPLRDWVSNGGFENGDNMWYAYNCTISTTSALAYDGELGLAATSRTEYNGGPAQQLAGDFASDQSYEFSAWARMASGTAQARFVLYILNDSYIETWFVTPGVTVGSTGWTQVTGEMTPSWTGTLQLAFFKISTESGTTALYVDDVQVTRSPTSEPRLVPVLGTWHRETTAAAALVTN